MPLQFYEKEALGLLDAIDKDDELYQLKMYKVACVLVLQVSRLCDEVANIIAPPPKDDEPENPDEPVRVGDNV